MVNHIRKGYTYDDVLIVPKYNPEKSRDDVSFKTRVTKNHHINIPLIAANMDTVCESEMAITIGKIGGLGVIHRFLTIDQQAREVRKTKKYDLLTAAAVGVKDYRERIPALHKAGLDIIVLDIAHAHSKLAGDATDWIKEHYSGIDLMVGNIATREAARYFVKKGADAVKVGIGPGSMCTTRIMTGCGVPQLTAIIDVFEETREAVPICADGGIKYPGDVVKAIGAGADNVMLGSILSGTYETPGKTIRRKGNLVKEYRGMASFEAAMRKRSIDGDKNRKKEVHVEGERTFVEYKGHVEPIVRAFLGGISSGMTYNGFSVIEDLRGRAEFIEISSAGLAESHAHGLKK